MTHSPNVIRKAGPSDAENLTQILATGFAMDPPLVWMLPDPVDRERLSAAFFRPFVDLALEQGLVDVTEDLTGCALWLHIDVTAEPEEDGDSFRKLFIDGLGERYAQRFFMIDDLFSAHHPGNESHAYLAFIGVTPTQQGHGVGRALLAHRLAVLDESGTPAYLEASSTRNAGLYRSLGFTPLGEGLAISEGPTFYPMWRAGRAV